MSKRPTLLVMAGGTGGHIFPGIAVAEYLQAQGWDIHWLGTAKRMEASLVPQHGFEISFINIAGIRNKSFATLLKTPFKLLQSVVQSMRVIRRVNPDVVLGMGGYASAPGGVAAWLLGKPLILHEQNAVAGMSNRYLARLASSVLSAFPNAFKKGIKAKVVGNPIRKAITEVAANHAALLDSENAAVNSETTPTRKVLVVGGSLGAQILNELVPSAINQLKGLNFEVWHQTGQDKLKQVIESYENTQLDESCYKITEFIDDMAAAYQWADVVICRAGALTVSELAIAGKPAIFIPLPHAVDDHQTKNAKYLVDKGAAKLLPQQHATSMQIAQLLNSVFATEKVVQAMSKAASDAAYRDATEQVAKACLEQVK
ncbi:MAG: undecaprenyldiphospho-muramoylpentapeptide beta-N-acetylglucosaminyltransferase [Thalassotalea sp.]